MTFSQPPAEFIWENITPYQQHSIKEKWYMYHFVSSYDGSKHAAFRELAKELNLSFQHVADKYYQIK